MTDFHVRVSGPHHFGLSLNALINLRWLAVAGQTIALAIVELGLDFALPAVPAFLVVGITAAVNIALRIAYCSTYRFSDRESGARLSFYIAQLTTLHS